MKTKLFFNDDRLCFDLKSFIEEFNLPEDDVLEEVYWMISFLKEENKDLDSKIAYSDERLGEIANISLAYYILGKFLDDDSCAKEFLYFKIYVDQYIAENFL